MLKYCDSCKSRESGIVTYQAQGKAVRLCPACAEQKGANALAFPAGRAWRQDLNVEVTVREIELDHVVSCPCCDQTMADFTASAAFGCGACRSAFAHAEAESAFPGLARALRVADLRLSLQRAVAAEEYEQAARIRDLINNVEAGKPPVPGATHV